VKTTYVEIMDINVKISGSEQEFGIKSIKMKTIGNRYEPETTLEDKVYSKMYYNHQPRSVA
jgi:hypothetical protein